MDQCKDTEIRLVRLFEYSQGILEEGQRSAIPTHVDQGDAIRQEYRSQPLLIFQPLPDPQTFLKMCQADLLFALPYRQQSVGSKRQRMRGTTGLQGWRGQSTFCPQATLTKVAAPVPEPGQRKDERGQ